MSLRTASAARRERGVTMVEVLVAALLIFLALGSILALNIRSVHILRSTRQALAGSQMLQQRIEAIRNRPWPEISNSTAMQQLMKIPVDSEKELADAKSVEFVSVSVPDALGSEVAGSRAFSLRRQHGIVTIIEEGDLGTQPMILINASLQWRDVHGTQQRTVRTVLCRTGLTRSGIFGSGLGRPPAPGAKLSPGP